MTTNKNMIITVLAIIFILSIILIVYVVSGDNLSQTVDGSISDTLKEQGFVVIPSTEDGAGIAVDTDFKIICEEEQNKKFIESTLDIQPKADYELKKLSKKEYLVKFQKELKTDTVYKVSMLNTDDEELSWAFQTVKSFKLVSTLPRDKSADVLVNSGIEMQFSYPYIENLEDCFEIEPKIDGEFTYNKNVAVFMPKDTLEEDTLYTVTIKAGVGINGSDEVTQEDYTFKFISGSEDCMNREYFYFMNPVYNFSSKTVPYLQMITSKDLSNEELAVDIYSYNNEDDFIEDNKKISDGDAYWRDRAKIKIDVNSSDLNKVLNFNTTLVWNNQYGGEIYLELPEELAEGYYLVNVNKDDINYQTMLQINDTAVYIMYGENESLAWVNDSITGKAISGAVFESETGQISETDSEGVAVISYEASQETPEINYFKVTSPGHPTYFANMTNNYMPYDYGYYYDSPINNNYWSYVYTDRELYLPTDKMNFWGLIKARDNKTKIDSVTINLYKYDYYTDKYELDKKEVPLDGFGCFNGEWEFSDLLPGRYYLEISNGDEMIAGKYFDIRRYEKPSYIINAEFDNKNIFMWEKTDLNIQANFYEGSPVSGLELECSYYEDGDYNVISEIVCDKNGSYQIEYNPSITTDIWYPQNIHMNIYNTQAEEQNIQKDFNILVFPKDMMLNIDTKAVEDKEDEEQIEIRTNLIDINKEVDEEKWSSTEDRYKGAPIDTEIEISLYEVTHNKVEVGEYYDFINKVVQKQYRYEDSTELIDTFSAATKNGIYKMNIPLEADKDYKISVQSFDTRGNKIIEEAWVNNFKYKNYYSNQVYYSVAEQDESKETYMVGENVNLKLMVDNEDAIEKTGDKLLFLKMQDGLKEYSTSDVLTKEYTFNENDIPNYYVCAVYFDGENIYQAGQKNITYNYHEKELDIKVNAEKDNYRPGDTVKLNVEVKNKDGIPQKANVNLSVVDEALFSLSEQYVSTLVEIYSYTFGTGIIQSDISNKEADMFGNMMAEGGGGEDQRSMIRSEFLDTAIFKTVTTNADGKGSISFELPDNLTSWRVTYQGITADLQADSGKMNINTKLPYFITLILSNTYMEGDNPQVSVRSYGTETDSSDKILYHLTLENQDGDKKEFDMKATGNEYANFVLGELEKGEYSITVEGENGSLSDGIKKQFEVVDSMLSTRVYDYIELKDNTKIADDNGYTTINFYNKECSTFYNTLTSLAYTFGSRVDQILSRKISTEMMAEYFDTEEFDGDYQLDNYQICDGGIALLPYASSDPLLSAKVVSVASESFDTYRLNEYFEGVIGNEESTGVDIASAYWGLASVVEPVLLDIQNIISNEELSIKERIIYGLGLLEFGDTSGARNIYNSIMNDYSKKSGDYVYIDTGIDQDDIIEATSLMSIMALRLDSDNKYELLDYVTNNRPENILTNLEQLMFVKYDLPNVKQEASFTYELDGKKSDIKLVDTDSFTLFLNEEQISNLKFSNVSENVTAAVSYIGKVKDSGLTQNENFDITRTYQAIGGSSQTFNQSDLVKITITPNFSKSATEGYYEITDVIPAGLRYITKEYRDDDTTYPIEIDGQRLVFGKYYSKGEPVNPIVYYVRAAAPGTYTADNAIIMHYASNSMNLTEQEELVIEAE